MKKILITGGQGKLARAIIATNTKYKIKAPSKDDLNIHNDSLYLINIFKPDYVIHTAALTKPMLQHEKDPYNSIQTNIIGTCNVVKSCIKNNVKLIYISTDYVYPGITGDYKETDSILPFTNYGWSKLGGECAVQMYANSLIIRLCLCNKPFEHEFAFDDMIKNYIYEEEAAKIILDLLDECGIINIGGPTQSVYNFVKQNNPQIKPKHTEYFKPIPLNTSMNMDKLNEISRRRQSTTTS